MDSAMKRLGRMLSWHRSVSGRTELARLSLAKLENRRIATGTFAGAYGSIKGETSYTFDELEALFALMAMKP